MGTGSLQGGAVQGTWCPTTVRQVQNLCRPVSHAGGNLLLSLSLSSAGCQIQRSTCQPNRNEEVTRGACLQKSDSLQRGSYITFNDTGGSGVDQGNHILPGQLRLSEIISDACFFWEGAKSSMEPCLQPCEQLFCKKPKITSVAGRAVPNPREIPETRRLRGTRRAERFNREKRRREEFDRVGAVSMTKS